MNPEEERVANPNEPPGGWREHMHFDHAGRLRKARKLVSLVDSQRPLSGARILDIGTGTGFIASELARAAGPDGEVTSVDIMDTRMVVEGFDFRRILDSTLPVADASYDVVVSNHVIEHVGPGDQRQTHLDEVARVLAPGGFCYLATPSRWALVEPHFKVPLLSWLPVAARSRYLRLARRGQHYDVYPLGPRELDRAAQRAGLRVKDGAGVAVAAVGRSRSAFVGTLLERLPGRAWQFVSPLLPTLVRFLHRAA